MESGYIYDQSFEGERARLAGMEAQWDPGTMRHIDALGLSPDSRCWEIGAGAGSIAGWVSERAGSVLVTDVDVRFVEQLAGDRVTVKKHDIVADEMPEGSFSLIHARLLLEHLPARDQVLDRLVAALEPGGWLLIEDYDFTSYGTDPASEVGDRVAAAIVELMQEAGFDPYLGRRLVREFRDRNLTEVAGEGRLLVMDAKHPGMDFYRLSLVSVRDVLAERGAITQAEIDQVLAEMDSDEGTVFSPTMVAAWGRAPG